MNLRDALSPEHGPPYPDPLEARDFAWLTAFVNGWGSAIGADLVTSTNGPTMRIHDLGTNRRSPKIRRGDWTAGELRRCALLHLGRRGVWEEESDRWGADPFHESERDS